jgi:hypothetical protein
MGAVDDCWTGIARAFAIVCVAIVWHLAAWVELNDIQLEFCGLSIDYRVVCPPVFSLCYAGIVCLPFWLFVGFVGHPVTVFIALVEACNRYCFGQSGTVGSCHLLWQFGRGVVSIGLSCFFLNEFESRLALSLCIAWSTFVGMFPISWKRDHLADSFPSLLWSIACAGTAFGIPYFVLEVSGSWPLILAGVWLGLFDVLLPYAFSYNRYGLVHFILYRGPVTAIPKVRGLTPLCIVPLAIAAILRTPTQTSFIIAFILTHAVQKGHTEPHVFALAFLLASVTLPIELNLLSGDAAFCWALLIAAKWEVLLPPLRYFARSRPIPEDTFFAQTGPAAVLAHFLAASQQRCPGPDWCTKLISLFWTVLTGATFCLVQGKTWLTFPGSIRPFFFFDFPVKEAVTFKELLKRAVDEHPIEAPVYTSAALELGKNFSRLARNGRLGLVSCGDIFLFMSGELLLFVHVVAIEPSSFRVQLRGLEYSSQTLCHRGEATLVQDFADDTSSLRRANRAMVTGYELRALEIELNMYDVAKSTLEGAFIAVTPADQYTWFMFAFCWVAASGRLNVADLPEPPTEFAPGLGRARALAGQISLLFDRLDSTKTVEEVNRLTDFWGAMLTVIFKDGILDPKPLVAAFRDKPWIPDELRVDDDHLKQMLGAAVRLGVSCTYLASALYAPTREHKTVETFLNEVVEFFKQIDNDLMAVPLGTDDFERAFFEGQKPLLTLEEARTAVPVPTMMRFALAEKEWAVFRIDQELVRGLWASEIRDILFFEQSKSERQSIALNATFLNNMVLQSCDSPIGYPALTTSFLESHVNPWTS